MLSKIRPGLRQIHTSIERFTKVHRTPFPVYNPIDLKVKGKKGELYRLATYEYPSHGPTQAQIFFLPAYGDYCQNYGYFFQKFAEQGMSVYAFDRRGFGLSEGPKGDLGNHLIDDHWAFMDAVGRDRYLGSAPKFLFGYDFGGLIATRLCEFEGKQDYFDGVIAAAPFFQWKHPYTPLQIAKFSAQHLLNPNAPVEDSAIHDLETEAFIG
jgi:alpha-beta hydrolase superfamily lysophospholipase